MVSSMSDTPLLPRPENASLLRVDATTPAYVPFPT